MENYDVNVKIVELLDELIKLDLKFDDADFREYIANIRNSLHRIAPAIEKEIIKLKRGE